MRVRVGGGCALGCAVEADRTVVEATREHPREAVQRALLRAGVMLERAHDAGRERALGTAVGPVQQQKAVGPALAHEVGERTIEALLHALVADQARSTLATVGVDELLV